jgi:hypothetical protein
MLDERRVVGAVVVELAGSAVLVRTLRRDWVGWPLSEQGNGRGGLVELRKPLVVEEGEMAPRRQVTKARLVVSVLMGRWGDQLMKCRWAWRECRLRLAEVGRVDSLAERSFRLLMAYRPWLEVQE